MPQSRALGNFSDSIFAWMLTANGSGGYNPIITDLQFAGRADGNFTVSKMSTGSSSAVSLPEVRKQEQGSCGGWQPQR